MKTKWQIRETQKKVNPTYFDLAIQGKLAAYVIRGFLPNNDCKKLVKNFEHHPLKRTIRVGKHLIKQDLKLLGPTWRSRQYTKKFEFAKKDQAILDGLFKNITNPHKKLIMLLDDYYHTSQNIHFRPMRKNSHDITYGVVQRWTGSEYGYIARAHTDYHYFRRFRSVEMGHIISAGSCVICYQNGHSGAHTRIYNYIPTIKENKDAEYYDEKPHLLKKLKKKPTYLQKLERAISVDVVLKPGDVLFFSVKYFHDVVTTRPDDPRVTSYIFYGQLKGGDLIYWY